MPEADRLRAKRLRDLLPGEWPADDRRAVTAIARAEGAEVLPEKSVLGSTYPFEDFGQMSGVQWVGGPEVKAISGALGGFSNVWGAQAYPFTKRALKSWPDDGRTMDEAYRNVMSAVPVAGRNDNLASVLPTYGHLLDLPPLADRSRFMLEASARAEERLADRRLVVGAARVGFRAHECVSCGLCNSGCVWDLLFSTRQLFERWVVKRQIRYHHNVRALSISAGHGGQAVVHGMTLAGAPTSFIADRVYLGAGALGSTRIVFNSAPAIRYTTMLETRQLIVPFWSRRPVPNPEDHPRFTVAQAAMLIAPDSADEAFLQFYPYDPSFNGALPPLLRGRAALRRPLLRHLSAGIVYLNSEQSPRLTVTRVVAGVGQDQARISVAGESMSLVDRNVRRVVRTLLSAGHALDLWPILPAAKVAPPGRSYHWGGSFPYSPREPDGTTTDRCGRLPWWPNVHLIDAATFPTLAPTGFLLTIMANANRIAEESLRLGD